MRNIRIIAKRELKSYFATPVAFVFIVIFLALTGDTAWLSVGNPNDDSGFGLYNLELCRTSRINIDLQKPLNFISNV